MKWEEIHFRQSLVVTNIVTGRLDTDDDAIDKTETATDAIIDQTETVGDDIDRGEADHRLFAPVTETHLWHNNTSCQTAPTAHHPTTPTCLLCKTQISYLHTYICSTI